MSHQRVQNKFNYVEKSKEQAIVDPALKQKYKEIVLKRKQAQKELDSFIQSDSTTVNDSFLDASISSQSQSFCDLLDFVEGQNVTLKLKTKIRETDANSNCNDEELPLQLGGESFMTFINSQKPTAQLQKKYKSPQEKLMNEFLQKPKNDSEGSTLTELNKIQVEINNGIVKSLFDQFVIRTKMTQQEKKSQNKQYSQKKVLKK